MPLRPLSEAAAGLRPVVSRARRAVYAGSDVVLLSKVLDDAPSPPGDLPPRVEVANTRHIAPMAELIRRQYGWDVSQLLSERMASGAGAVAGYLDGELMAYIWWVGAEAMRRVEPLLPIRYGIRLGESDVYGFDLVVAAEHRGAGNATRFLAGAEAELRRLGYRRMLSYVLPGNRPARWLFSISGHETVGRQQSQVLLSRFLRVDGSLLFAGRNGFKGLLG
jgi:GNAT superfamily N-acetyltransferase